MINEIIGLSLTLYLIYNVIFNLFSKRMQTLSQLMDQMMPALYLKRNPRYLFLIKIQLNTSQVHFFTMLVNDLEDIIFGPTVSFRNLILDYEL